MWVLVFVNAYNPGSPPSVFGHSGEELEVRGVSGNIKTLQQAILENDLHNKTYSHFMDYDIYTALWNTDTNSFDFEDGYHDFIVPSGVSKMKVQLWGGGGGGASGSFGGGGGGYVEAEILVSPNTRYNIKVGERGLRSNGGASSFVGPVVNLNANGGLSNGNGGSGSVSGANVINSFIVDGTAASSGFGGNSYGGAGGVASTSYLETAMGEGGVNLIRGANGRVVVWW